MYNEKSMALKLNHVTHRNTFLITKKKNNLLKHIGSVQMEFFFAQFKRFLEYRI